MSLTPTCASECLVWRVLSLQRYSIEAKLLACANCHLRPPPCQFLKPTETQGDQMTNGQLVAIAKSMNIDHPVLSLPATPLFDRWLIRPLRLALQFSHICVVPLEDCLDTVMADWQEYERSNEDPVAPREGD